MMRLVLVWVFVSYALLLGAQLDGAFAAGNDAYKKKDYSTAINAYTSILEGGQASAELYYNLANAYFKSGQLGKAILNYERAHKAKPSDKNIFNNLVLAREEVDTTVIEIPEFFLLRYWKSFASLLSPLLWMVLELLFGILILIGVYKWRLGGEEQVRAQGLGLVLAGLGLLLITHFAARSAQAQIAEDPSGIVISSTSLYTAADERSEATEALSEGVKVNVLDGVDNWYQVVLMNKEKGWVQKDRVEMIRD